MHRLKAILEKVEKAVINPLRVKAKKAIPSIQDGFLFYIGKSS